MPTWPAYFVVIIAIAFVMQTAILAAMFFQMKRSNEQLMRTVICTPASRRSSRAWNHS
jgi:hypothetical protein